MSERDDLLREMSDLADRHRRAQVRGDTGTERACASLLDQVRTRLLALADADRIDRLAERLHAVYSARPQLSNVDWMRLFTGQATEQEWQQMAAAQSLATTAELQQAQAVFNRVTAGHRPSRQWEDRYRQAATRYRVAHARAAFTR